MRLRNNIRRLRFEHSEMTQQELANAVGVTRVTIHSIEKGRFTPSALLALRIARYFGVPFEGAFDIVEDDTDEKD